MHRLAFLSILAVAACGGSSSSAPEPTGAEPVATPVETEAPAAAEAPAVETEAPAAAEAPAADTGRQPAPAFTLTDLAGAEHDLASYRGKVVVLEWFNPGCPFVKYAHGEGPLTELPTEATGDDVVWLAINSNKAGSQGHGAELNRKAASGWNMSYPLLLDEDGEVGRAYGAKTTPHMFVIDAEGNLAYDGALDNAPLGKPDGEYVNYVEAAMADLEAGREVATASTKPYGCSVKY